MRVHVYGDDGRPTSLGSGFVVGADGRILTNYHVIRQGARYTISFGDEPVREVKAVLAKDAAADLAVLRVDAANLRPCLYVPIAPPLVKRAMRLDLLRV